MVVSCSFQTAENLFGQLERDFRLLLTILVIFGDFCTLKIEGNGFMGDFYPLKAQCKLKLNFDF
jgi:hypothetical protein